MDHVYAVYDSTTGHDLHSSQGAFLRSRGWCCKMLVTLWLF